MEQNKQRIVVKVGTSTLTHNSGALDLWSMEHLVRTLADLQGMGHEVILVSSGAIAVGTAKLGLSERPKELRMKQAAAAVGQCRMMHIYDKFFSEYNRSMAQILLTGDDVEDPERAEHLSNTFSALLEMGVIPVVNENDSVSSAEIETGRHKVLGDNDTLSAIVAELCRAALERHGIADWFRGVVTTQETGLEKRDPALYRLAAAQWGVPPKDCVLFEDSPGYCAAAGEAGFYVAGVRDPLYAGREEELRRLCGSWVDSLEQLPPELEARLFSGT